MKRSKSICTLLLIMSIALVSCNKLEKKAPCLPKGLGKSVVAFYTFSNGSLNDISGDNLDLTNPTTASPTTDRDGNSNCAYIFNNSTISAEYLTTTSTSSLNNLDEFSISLWYQPLDTSRTGGSFETLINRDLGRSCPNRNGQWSVSLYDCRRAVFGRTNSVWDRLITTSDCKQEIIERTDVWAHLVATFKKDGDEMKIYRNGVLQDSSTEIADCGYSGQPDYQDIGDLFLGKDYTGKIDDVIIFKKTLSQQEVNSLYNMETCCE